MRCSDRPRAAAGCRRVGGSLGGLLPALHATRRGAEDDLGLGLHEAARSATASRRTRRTLSFLVLSEVALASLLVVGAGLLTRSFGRLLGVDLGFHGDRTLVVITQEEA